MKKIMAFIFYYMIGITIFLCGCTASKQGYAVKGENLAMKIKEEKNVIRIDDLKEQQAPDLASRNGSRGGIPVAGALGGLVSLASEALKTMIANEQKKYTASYAFGLNDLYFYDQLSTDGPFDPAGMQFNGFTLVRTFTNKTGIKDTAFVADFELDKTNSNEILNNSVFRLKLKKFELNYSKAKLGSDKKLNMDFEISINTSYVNEAGELFDNVLLGKFYLFIRGAPLDPAASTFEEYYKKLEGTKLTGRAFIVPRSVGYRKENNEILKSYSQGAYCIHVNVKESSKNNFVNKLIMENAGSAIDAGSIKLKAVINSSLQ